MHEERGYKGLVYEIAARLFDFVKAADTRDGLITRHRSFGAEAFSAQRRVRYLLERKTRLIVRPR